MDGICTEAPGFRRRLVRFGEMFRFFDAWKKEREDGAVVCGMLGTAEGEAALVAIDDAGGDPEAEAGAVEVLRGVEGLEEAGADGRGHAVAGIGDGDAEARAAVGVAGGVVHGVVGTNDEAAALTHGVDRVGDEVVEDLTDVVFKAEDGGGGGVAGLDVDAGVGEATVVEVENGVDEIGSADVGGRTAWRWKRRVWVAIWQTRESSL